ncbi:MAG: hypothetical protein ACMUIM_08905 [bacterium]
MSIEIEEHALKKACLEMIETIIMCLPNAFKGTIYRVGKPPDLVVERITSGLVSEDRKKITWELPAQSEYNPPGRPWKAYRDEPGRPMEAMAWCVEKQKSWTAEDPTNDIRSVRLQMDVGVEDFQHMEPVLARKSDLNLNIYSSFEYPTTYDGRRIWTDSDYVVVAVIKIHFRPYTIKIGSQETRVIKKLSRSLGTELLSYHLHQNSMKAMQQLAQDRLNACDILADSLRNAITKSGLIFSLMKQEIGYLRDQWENALLLECEEECIKGTCIEGLNKLLMDLAEVDEGIKKNLINIQTKFLELSLTPEQGERWINMQIKGRWDDIFRQYPQYESQRMRIWQEVDRLKQSLQFGQDLNIISKYNKMPDELTREWVDIIYSNLESFNPYFLDRLISILDNPILDIPSRDRSRKSLIQLKALAETMNQLERNTNFLLHQVLNGNHGKDAINHLQHPIPHTPMDERPVQRRSRI